jgi:hypothetical protein
MKQLLTFQPGVNMKTPLDSILAVSLFALCTGFAPIVLAIELQEGKWAVTTTTVSPMSPQPMEEYSENCIEDSNFDPVSEMMDQQMSSMCEVTVNANTASTLDADLSCNMQGAGTMTGKLAFSADGDSANGLIDMSMSFNGQTMAMSNTWKAEFLGACD